MATQADISMIRDRTKTWQIQVYNAGGTIPYDLTYSDVFFTVRRSLNMVDLEDSTAIIKKDTQQGNINVTDYVNGIFQVTILPDDTITTPVGTYYWDVAIQQTQEKRWTALQGKFNLQPNVTFRGGDI